MFSKFGINESDKAEKFYSKKWHPFEKSLPSGSHSAFFPVFAYIVLQGKVTKAAAFTELQKNWKTTDPATVLERLQEYSPYYVALTKYRPLPGLSKAVNSQIDRFSRMPRTRVTWPFIIQVLHAVEADTIKEKAALRSLAIVEAFLVRRALVGREPTGLHAVFKTLWPKTKGDPKDVLSKIVTRTILSPSNDELTAFLRKERSDTRVMLRYLLGEYEHDYTKANKFDPPTETVATLEHVLPRNLTTEWAKEFSETEHQQLVGQLGNLVALSEGQNKSLKDQPWKEKRKRFAGSDFKSTRALAKLEEWTADSITTRTKELTEWILDRWPELDSI